MADRTVQVHVSANTHGRILHRDLRALSEPFEQFRAIAQQLGLRVTPLVITDDRDDIEVGGLPALEPDPAA